MRMYDKDGNLKVVANDGNGIYSLNDLNDVNYSGAAVGDVLRYNGSVWENDPRLRGMTPIRVFDRSGVVSEEFTVSQVLFNGGTANYNSVNGYQGIFYVDLNEYRNSDTSISMQIRIGLDWATTANNPSARMYAYLFPAASVSSGALTVGTVVTGTAMAGVTGLNELGASRSPWVSITSSGFYAPLFNWDTQASALGAMINMFVELRQTP